MNLNCFVSCCLILRSGDEVLLQARTNTGHGDGCWGFIGGGHRGNIRLTQSITQIAKEKLDIHVREEDLELSNVVHIISDGTHPEEVAFYYTASKFSGEIKNCQPERYRELKFFPLDQLPANMFDEGAIANLKSKKIILEK
jgi:8-oxo-dGTP diphosphatase